MSPSASDRSSSGARRTRPRARGPAHEVAAHQQARLPGAIVAAVAEHGYDRVTVRDVVALAGVSRATFYEHYADKQEAFVATLGLLVERGLAQIAGAARAEPDERARLGATIRAIATVVAEHPAMARVALLEVRGAGAAATERATLAQDTVEGLVRDGLAAPAAAEVSPVAVRAIVAGVHRIASDGLRRGDPALALAHAAELTAWAAAYHVPGVAPPAGPPLTGRPLDEPLPHEDPGAGFFRTPQGRMALDHRARIEHATAAIVGEHGYAGLSVPAITATAAISNQTFYEHFRNKEQAFLTTADGIADDLLAAFHRGHDGVPGWPAALRGGLDALLARIAQRPTCSRLVLCDLGAAGSAANERAEALFAELRAFLEPGLALRTAAGRPPLIADAVTAGLWTTIARELTGGRAAWLPRRTAELTYVALAPFTGPRAAQRAAQDGQVSGSSRR